MSEFSKIAFLGTVLMGSPMCKNLLSAGLPLTMWNRSQAKTDPLAKRGAEVADSPNSAVTDSDVVITMLSDGTAVADIMFVQGVAEAICEGATRIDMSSIGTHEAIDHAKRHTEHGVCYLNAPFSGGTKGAVAGELAIMAGGDAETFVAVCPAWTSDARGAKRMRPIGQARQPGNCGHHHRCCERSVDSCWWRNCRDVIPTKEAQNVEPQSGK